MSEYIAKQTQNLPRLCFDAQKSGLGCVDPAPGAEAFSADAFVSECRTRVTLETLLHDLAVYGAAVHSALLDALNTHFAAFSSLSGTLVQQTQRVRPVQLCLEDIAARLDAWVETLARLEAEHRALLDHAGAVARQRALAQTLRSALTTTQRLEHALASADTDIERSAHLLSVATWLCTGPLATTPLATGLGPRLQAARRELLARAAAALANALAARDTAALAACLRAYAALDAAAEAQRTFADTVLAPVLQRAAEHTLVAPLDAAALHRFFAGLTGVISEEGALLSAAAPPPQTLFLATVLASVDALLVARAPGVFSAALPAAFRACFAEAAAFLAVVERACPTPAVRAALRSCPEYVQLQRRWNTRLYFQICAQDVAAPLELSLSLPRRNQLLFHPATSSSSSSSPSQAPSPPPPATATTDYGLRTTGLLLHTLRQCFTTAPPPGDSPAGRGSRQAEEGFFLAPVLQQATRLSLQLIGRYSAWIADGAAARYAGTRAALPVSSLATSGAAPAPQGQGRAPAATPGEPWGSFSVQDFLVPYRDCLVVERFCGDELPRLLRACVAAAHPDDSSALQERVLAALQACVGEGCAGLRRARGECETMFLGTTAHLCCGGLKQMYGIMAAIRVTAAPAPGSREAPSHYVAGVLEPLAQLLERARACAPDDVRRAWARTVCDSVFSRATEICGELVMTAYQTDDMLSRMTAGAADDGGAAREPPAGSTADTSRFLAQLTVDIEHLGRCAERLGVALDTTPAYQRLCRCLKVM